MNDLEADYVRLKLKADAFLTELLHQLESLLKSEGILLGIPLNGRVKSWDSIKKKIEGAKPTIQRCQDVKDLIGIRLVCIFSRDVEKTVALIEKELRVQSKENKAAALATSTFGYTSQHLEVALPDPWLKIPAFASCGSFTVEIQVRSLAQHIWAVASHQLQYKREADVPEGMSRSIHRVAAILELVDLEFERVLDERDTYVASSDATLPAKALDTDNLKLVMDELLPGKNRSGDENYSEILADLNDNGISTVSALRELIVQNLAAALAEDTRNVNDAIMRRTQGLPIGTDSEFLDRGVYFSHVGLMRQLLTYGLGRDWWEARKEKTGTESHVKPW